MGFGYRGPRQKKSEDRHEFRNRLVQYIRENQEEHYYRFMAKPTMDDFQRFCHACLYPILSAFVRWYLAMIHPDRKSLVNDYHWMTPYGLYDPFQQGTAEKFRHYRLHGSTLGLKPRKKF